MDIPIKLFSSADLSGCPIQRVLENDFVVVTGTARDFIRLLSVELQRENRLARLAN